MIDSLRVVLSDGKELAVGQWNRKWVVGLRTPGEREELTSFGDKCAAVTAFMEIAKVRGIQQNQQ